MYPEREVQLTTLWFVSLTFLAVGSTISGSLALVAAIPALCLAIALPVIIVALLARRSLGFE